MHSKNIDGTNHYIDPASFVDQSEIPDARCFCVSFNVFLSSTQLSLDNIAQRAYGQERGFRIYSPMRETGHVVKCLQEFEAAVLPVRFVRVVRIGMMQDHHAEPGGTWADS